MASHTIAQAPWAPATSVSVYPAAAQPAGVDAPSGPVVTSAIVDSAQSVTFAGLSQGIRYVAYAGGIAKRFLIPADADALEPVRTRVEDLETRAGTVESGTVAFDAATEIDRTGVSAGADALTALIATYAGSRPLHFRAGSYLLDERVVLLSNTRITRDPGAVFVVNAVDALSGTAIFHGTGTDGTKVSLTANASAGAMTVALPTGQGANFSAGDLIGLESTTVVNGTDGRAREQHMVISVATDTVTIDGSLEYDYLTSATAQFWKITPISDVQIDAAFRAGGSVSPGTDKTYAVRLDKSKDVRLNVALQNMLGGVLLADAYKPKIDRLRVDRLPSFSDSYGYGIALAGACMGAQIDGLTGHHNRHLFTTLADERAGSTFWGGPLHTQVNQAIGYGGPSSFSVFDTHQYDRHTHFNGCIAVGGGASCSGFQLRSKHGQLNGCKSWRAGLRAINATVESEGWEVNGGVFAYAASNGVSLDGTENKLKRATIRDCGGAGVVLAATAVSPEVDGCNVLRNTDYGIQDQGATNPRIRGGSIPKAGASPAQAVAVLNLGATGIVADTEILGYGAGTSPFSGINASAKVKNVMADAGLIGNQPVYLGNAGVAPNFDTILFRGGSGQLRSDAVIRSTKAIQTANYDTTAKTSAQIDALITGVTLADGMMIYDSVNSLFLVRQGGKWYKTAALTQIA